MKLNVIGSNQTELCKDGGITIFFSYNTPVLVFDPGRGTLVSKSKYSITTSRHVNCQVKRYPGPRIDVDQSEVNSYVD